VLPQRMQTYKLLTKSVLLQDVKLQPLPNLSDKSRPRELLQVIGKFVFCTESPLSIIICPTATLPHHKFEIFVKNGKLSLEIYCNCSHQTFLARWFGLERQEGSTFFLKYFPSMMFAISLPILFLTDLQFSTYDNVHHCIYNILKFM